MKPLHAYAASFLPWLLAWLWWLNRDTGMFAAYDSPPWYVWIFLAFIAVQAWPTIRGGVASVWQRVRSNMPTEANPWSLTPILVAVVIGVLIGWFAARVDFTPSPQPKPDVPVVAPDEPVKVSAVTYVYEKDSGSVPSDVLVALDKLNKQGILATAFEEDTVDGSGETPSQYKDALEASKDNRPALVVTRGNKLKVHPKVTTEAQVLEAAK